MSNSCYVNGCEEDREPIGPYCEDHLKQAEPVSWREWIQMRIQRKRR